MHHAERQRLKPGGFAPIHHTRERATRRHAAFRHGVRVCVGHGIGNRLSHGDRIAVQPQGHGRDHGHPHMANSKGRGERHGRENMGGVKMADQQLVADIGPTHLALQRKGQPLRLIEPQSMGNNRDRRIQQRHKTDTQNMIGCTHGRHYPRSSDARTTLSAISAIFLLWFMADLRRSA